MGKFSELDIELKEWTEKRKKTSQTLVILYPFMKDFISQAFDYGDEEKVFELILALEPGFLPC